MARVKGLIARLRVKKLEVTRGTGVGYTAFYSWMTGQKTRLPSTAKAGAAAMHWSHANKDRPTPPAPAWIQQRYNPADAARVKKLTLMAQLGMRQVGVVRAAGINQVALSRWLGGWRTPRSPAAARAGAAAMHWFEANKSRALAADLSAAETSADALEARCAT